MDALKELGLTGYEIKIYETLVKIGRSDAKEISKISKVPPTATYPNLKSLEEKQLIQKYDGEIKYYEANDPKIAIKNFVDKKIMNFKKLEEESITQINNLEKEEKQEDLEPIKLSVGLKSSHNISSEIINNSKKYIYIMGWAFKKSSGMFEIIQQLNTLRKNGVDVKFILADKTPNGLKFKKQCEELNIPCRMYKTQNMSIIISDDKKCKITLKKDKLKDRINLKVDDDNLVSALKDYFLSIWKKAKH